MKKPRWEAELVEDGTLRVLIEGDARPFHIVMNGLKNLPASEAISTIGAMVEMRAADARLRGLEYNVSRIVSIELLNSRAAEEARTKTPPRLAENLFSAFAPKKSADAQLGDLQEIFQENVKRFGLERARRMYWIRISREIGPLLFQKLKRLGIIAMLIDYGRTKLGL